MFFSQVVLAKKGPLGKVWLAAHWDRKLTKKDILSANIVESVAVIKKPHKGIPYALRMSGHLLLGVVRIYARKVKYLMSDCSDALVKIKMAFRPAITGQSAVVDLPQAAQAAQVGHITMTTNFEDIEEITLPETITSDDFFDMAHTVRSNLTTLPESHEEELFATQVGDEFNTWDDDEGFTAVVQPELARGRSSAASSRSATPARGSEGDISRIDFGDDGGFQFDGDMGDFSMADIPDLEVGDAPKMLGTERFMEGSIPDARAQKRKRLASVPVDENTMLSASAIKNQLKDTQSTLRDREEAPATKRAMWERHRQMEGVEATFNSPCVSGLADNLKSLFKMQPTLEIGRIEEGLEVADFRHEEGAGGFDFEGPSGWDASGFDDEGGFQPEFDDPSMLRSEDGDLLLPEGGHEETSYTDRTEKVKRFVASRFEDEGDEMSFFELVEGKSKKVAAGTFFEFLVLKNRDIIDVRQEEPYADIAITKGPRW